MAKLRERSDQQIEVILERRHVILLGFCALVLGSLLFLLGMLTQRHLLGQPLATVLAQTGKSTPPPLFPDRSAEPTVRDEGFEFYDSLAGARDGKDRKSRRQRKGAEAPPAAVPAVARETAASAPDRPAAQTARQAGAPLSRDARQKSAATSQAKAAGPKAGETRAAAAAAPSQRSRSAPAPHSGKSSAPPARAEAPPDPRSGYALQVAALSSKQSAQDYIQRLKAKGFPAFLDQARVSGKLLYRVKVGTYPSRDKAKKAASKLEAEVGKRVLVQKEAEG